MKSPFPIRKSRPPKSKPTSPGRRPRRIKPKAFTPKTDAQRLRALKLRMQLANNELLTAIRKQRNAERALRGFRLRNVK